MFFRRSLRKKPDEPAELADAELIRRYQDPTWEPPWDLRLVGELFGRYMHLIYGVCLKYLRNEEDAKDAVMQVFEKLVVELQRNAAQDKPIQYFKSWLHTLVKNHCLMWLRSRQSKSGRQAVGYSLDSFVREVGADEELRAMELAAEEHLSEDNSLEHDLTLLEKGLQALPREQKTCLELFYLQGKCYKEIAEITGYELNRVKSCIQNGKRNLKIYLEKHHG
jgi:RNA polymerase sigma-70 factor (ECF subfamily)